MAFTGLVPSEHSSGERTHRGAHHPRRQRRTCAPNWSSPPGPTSPGPASAPSCAAATHGLDPDVVARAWAAQLRLCGRFRRLDARKTNRNIVVTAIARELAGFVWAEMTA